MKHGRRSFVASLVSDMRKVMQPYTALKLKVEVSIYCLDIKETNPTNPKRTGKTNHAYQRLPENRETMRVSHMMLFSQSDAGNTSLSVGCLPEGPRA